VSVMVVGWESRPYDGGSWFERLCVLRGQVSKGYSNNEDSRWADVVGSVARSCDEAQKVMKIKSSTKQIAMECYSHGIWILIHWPHCK